VDRLKDMIVSGGENIYPAEIESVARELPEVKDIAVIGIPDVKWGEAVMAVVVRSSDQLTEQKLLDFLRSRIGGYKVPKFVTFVESLPYNASGKLLKRALRDQYGDRPTIGYVGTR
jgi:acyl-CoA synthetase (AMP-forming)/AMP-acid ligase II